MQGSRIVEVAEALDTLEVKNKASGNKKFVFGNRNKFSGHNLF
jgi:hypothetical protein